MQKFPILPTFYLNVFLSVLCVLFPQSFTMKRKVIIKIWSLHCCEDLYCNVLDYDTM
jgi:hypothetical protein